MKKKIGQMFIIRMNGKEITDELVTLIKDYNIGGISIYSKNYDSYKEMHKLINKIKKINKKYNDTPIFIAIDEEGGRVDRLPDDFNTLPAAKRLRKDIKYVKEDGLLIKEMLEKLGVNLNFAPVFDIQRFGDYHIIGNRALGESSQEVIKNGITMVNIFNDNVIPVVKHFPGQGLFKNDPHILLPSTNVNIDKEEDIEPFKEAIKNKCPAIMISHVLIRKMDLFNPASLSKKVIKDYLKDELKYKGLVITDDLKMKSVNILYGYKKSCLKAINAGNNVLLMGGKYNDVINCINYIEKKMNKSLKKDIELSYDKILDIKKKYHINDEPTNKIDIEYYNNKIQELLDKVID